MVGARSGGKAVGQLRHFSVLSMDIFEAGGVGTTSFNGCDSLGVSAYTFRERSVYIRHFVGRCPFPVSQTGFMAHPGNRGVTQDFHCDKLVNRASDSW